MFLVGGASCLSSLPQSLCFLVAIEVSSFSPLNTLHHDAQAPKQWRWQMMDGYFRNREPE